MIELIFETLKMKSNCLESVDDGQADRHEDGEDVTSRKTRCNKWAEELLFKRRKK